MAYSTLEEAWGQDYKSFLSPASLSSDWLNGCENTNHNKASSGPPPTGYTSYGNQQRELLDYDDSPVIEHFNSDTDDMDLMLNHDEFNIPLNAYKAPTPDPGLDDYYNLINNSQYDNNPFQDNNYAEELQLNNYTKECDNAFPRRVKFHLKKCVHCRKRLKEWLEELDGLGSTTQMASTMNKKIINTTERDIKSVFPVQFRGYIDLIFFVALGIFLIFVLDTFVRLGKSFTRRRR